MKTSRLSPATSLKMPCDVLLAVDAYMPWSGGSRVYYENLYRRLSDRHHLRVRVETSHCDGDDAFDRKISSEWFQYSPPREPAYGLERPPCSSSGEKGYADCSRRRRMFACSNPLRRSLSARLCRHAASETRPGSVPRVCAWR